MNVNQDEFSKQQQQQQQQLNLKPESFSLENHNYDLCNCINVSYTPRQIMSAGNFIQVRFKTIPRSFDSILSSTHSKQPYRGYLLRYKFIKGKILFLILKVFWCKIVLINFLRKKISEISFIAFLNILESLQIRIINTETFKKLHFFLLLKF